MVGREERRFIPAAGYGGLLPLYDPVQRWLVGEGVKRELVAQAAIAPGARVLEIGCGTGSIALLAKRLHPEAELVGLDPDPAALAIARRKCERAGVGVQLERGFADALPYADAAFDRVLSSLMLHHLSREAKRAAFREVRRVLRPEGRLHVLDFGPPRGAYAALWARIHALGEEARDNVVGAIPALLGEAGLEGVRELGHRGSLFGTMVYYGAVRSVSA